MYFKNQKDIIPVTIIASGLLLSLLPFFSTNLSVIILGVLGVVLRGIGPTHHHYHGHCATFKSKYMNSAYDLVLMLATGHTTPEWKIHHSLGHHKDYLDPVYDVAGNNRFGANRPFKMASYIILGDILTIPDCYTVLKRRNLMNSKMRTAFERNMIVQIIVNLALLILNPKIYLLFILLPNQFLRWSILWESFFQHEGAPMDDVYSGSKNRIILNTITLNTGYHTAHHDRPGMHWSELKQHTEKIKHKIPENCLKSSFY